MAVRFCVPVQDALSFVVQAAVPAAVQPAMLRAVQTFAITLSSVLSFVSACLRNLNEDDYLGEMMNSAAAGSP